ncbi:MAG: FeoB-associated Cys-rich membrane protein [Muribaculaceae bacterium]|nr:FeoB-associated Cys-rich membrane protein [Muribaculaceae bacterium]
MIQWIIVAIIIAAALINVVRRLVRSHRRAEGSCSCCAAHCPLRKK